MNRRILALLLLLCLLLSGCTENPVSDKAEEEELRIVTSAYPAYDFARAIIGNTKNLHMLTRPGIDPHDYEPTPQNIIDLETCDVFIYNGGQSDAWVDQLLRSVENPDLVTIRMMDCAELLWEEHDAEETHEEEHHHAGEPDEHVWLSPRNVMSIAEVICETVSELDPESAESYQQNKEAYLDALRELDQTIQEIVDTAARKTIVFADRFPARYFTDAYGITCYAAFPGCSSHTEPDADTVAKLIDRIRAEEIPAVFRVPYSSSTLPEIISEETGATICLFNSFHNVSDKEYGRVTYLDVMMENAEALRYALN